MDETNPIQEGIIAKEVIFGETVHEDDRDKHGSNQMGPNISCF